MGRHQGKKVNLSLIGCLLVGLLQVLDLTVSLMFTRAKQSHASIALMKTLFDRPRRGEDPGVATQPFD